MANVNISKVYLLDVPLENDYKHTLYFKDKTAQHSYFETTVVKTFTEFSYQRKDNIIRLPEHIDRLYNCNYVMYQNSFYTNKWFYAFITDMKYVNDGCTELHIETDVMQTWMFDYTVLPSFVEREHTWDDDIGKNTIEEGLELGDYQCVQHTTDETFDENVTDMCYVLTATKQPVVDLLDTSKLSNAQGKLYNGIFSGCEYRRYNTPLEIIGALNMYADYGASDSITGLFMCPKFLAPTIAEGSSIIQDSLLPVSYKVAIGKSETLSNSEYTPRNKKLLTYPYQYLLVSNNQGSDVIYKYESFTDEDMLFPSESCNFVIKGALCPGGSIRMTPVNYKGCAENDIESINLGKFPICNWTNDMYTNWLTQNSINIAGMRVDSDQMNIAGSVMSSLMQVGSGIGLLASGAGALAGAGMIASGLGSGISGITNAVMQQKQHKLIPPQASGNLNAGDVITSSGKNTFHFYKMSIKYEYAWILDEYFDMFGYKSNQVKRPSRAHRELWWYTKTIDVNIDGTIPMNDLNKIKSAYNNGITFWRNAKVIKHYGLSNKIVADDDDIVLG